MEPLITIRRACRRDLGPALAYVQSRYHRKFGTEPSSLSTDCLIAENSRGVVGVLALHFSNGERFEFEDQFRFNFALLNKNRSQTVSFSRWVSNKPGVGIALMYCAVMTAMRQGATHSLSCARIETLRALRRRYGLPMDIIRVPVWSERIPPQDQNYFFTQPAPVLCAASLQRWYDRLDTISAEGVVLDI